MQTVQTQTRRQKRKRAEWGGKRPGQTGRPPKWPAGSERHTLMLPPDVLASIELVRRFHPGATLADAALAMLRLGGQHGVSGDEVSTRTNFAGFVKVRQI